MADAGQTHVEDAFAMEKDVVSEKEFVVYEVQEGEPPDQG